VLERREVLAGLPEIAVYVGAEEIADNRTAPAVDFGSVALGWPGPTQTFTVRNVGMATLTLGPPQVPGFQSRFSARIVQELGSVSEDLDRILAVRRRGAVGPLPLTVLGV